MWSFAEKRGILCSVIYEIIIEKSVTRLCFVQELLRIYHSTPELPRKIGTTGNKPEDGGGAAGGFYYRPQTGASIMHDYNCSTGTASRFG